MILPEVGVMRRSKVRPRVVLPQPDSPTSPRVSPLKTVELTLSTALTTGLDLEKSEREEENQTERLWTAMSCWGSGTILSGILISGTFISATSLSGTLVSGTLVSGTLVFGSSLSGRFISG